MSTDASPSSVVDIARIRGIDYDAIPDSNRFVVRTRLSKVFPLPQMAVFDSFTDPMSHVPLFRIIKGSTPPIRYGVHRIVPSNQFFAIEHVQESTLPPRLMFVRYTLEAPRRIIKEAITDPFLPREKRVAENSPDNGNERSSEPIDHSDAPGRRDSPPKPDEGEPRHPSEVPDRRDSPSGPEEEEGPIEPLDRKKGIVIMTFDKVDDAHTTIQAESTFYAETGAIFAREFIDRVWLNFYERMMVANGMIREDEMLTE